MINQPDNTQCDVNSTGYCEKHGREYYKCQSNTQELDEILRDNPTQRLKKHTNNAGQTSKNIRIAQVDQASTNYKRKVDDMNKTTTDLRQLAIKLAHEFNARFLDNYPEIFAIGDEPLGTWAISDQFWSLEDMALAMDSELTPDELLDWYWETVERRSVIKKRRKPTINLKSYIMGARYVEEV